MRDDHHRHAAERQLPHDLQHLTDHFGVECAGRLVKQHDLRLHRQRPHNGHALLLPAGELRGIGTGAVGKSHALQKRHGLLLRLGPGHFLDAYRRHRQVLQNRFMGKEVEMLEHHAHFLPVQRKIHLFPRDIHAVEQDRAGGRLFQQVQAPQEGAFSAAGRPDDRDHIALTDIHGDPVERLDLAAVVIFLQVSDLNQLFLHPSASCVRLLLRPALPRRSLRCIFLSKWPKTLLSVKVIMK